MKICTFLMSVVLLSYLMEIWSVLQDTVAKSALGAASGPEG